MSGVAICCVHRNYRNARWCWVVHGLREDGEHDAAKASYLAGRSCYNTLPCSRVSQSWETYPGCVGANEVHGVRVAFVERSYEGTMGMNSFVAGVVTGLAAAAIGQELAKEPSQRTWRGKVAGVPYNFRVAEWSDIANEYWNPSSDQILTPHAIGLGWGINFATVVRRAQRLMQTLQTTQPSDSTDQQRRIPEPVER